MTPEERKLLGTTAKMVERLAKQLGFDETAKEVFDVRLEASVSDGQRIAADEFEPAMLALNEAGIEYELEHTGGNVYVLYVQPGISITRDELHPDHWSVVTESRVRNEVRVGNLADVVDEFIRRARFPSGAIIPVEDTEWSTCPHCGSNDIEGGSVEIDGTYAHQGVDCLSCELRWAESYIAKSRTII